MFVALRGSERGEADDEGGAALLGHARGDFSAALGDHRRRGRWPIWRAMGRTGLEKGAGKISWRRETRSPSSALLPFLGERVLLLK